MESMTFKLSSVNLLLTTFLYVCLALLSGASRSQRMIFFLYRVFGKVCGAMPYVTKLFIFPFIPQSNRLPIWSALYIPPVVCACVCVCTVKPGHAYITSLHHHPFPLLLIYRGRLSWNLACTPLSWSVVPLWHINIPYVSPEFKPRRSADFLCICLLRHR